MALEARQPSGVAQRSIAWERRSHLFTTEPLLLMGLQRESATVAISLDVVSVLMEIVSCQCLMLP